MYSTFLRFKRIVRQTYTKIEKVRKGTNKCLLLCVQIVYKMFFICKEKIRNLKIC